MKGGESEMEGKSNGDLKSWDGFLGSNFLNAEDLDSEKDIFVCTGVEMDTENDRPILLLEREGIKSKFSLNVTNSNFLKNNGVASPSDATGKKITFKKVLVNNPRTNKEQEGLRISSVN